MNFHNIISPVLAQLSESISLLSDNEYAQKSLLLNGSSVGGHTRHVIELFQCLINGYKDGNINYEHRKRDIEIESNKKFACNLLDTIAAELQLPNKTLHLHGFYSENEAEECSVSTNFYRELIYNLEHTIHHMALIRVAINEVSNITLPENFGVASATMQYKKLCAQ
jgi:hypothetical protein